MLGIVDDEEQLDAAPDAANVTAEHTDVATSPSVVLVSVLCGLTIGLFTTTLVLLPVTLGGGLVSVLVALALPVATGALALTLLRVAAPRLDARVIFGVAAVLVGAVAIAPPVDADPVGSRILPVTAAAGLTVLTGRMIVVVRRTRAGVLTWNRAYLRLAADARRAVSSRLDLVAAPVGTGHRFTGTVTYADEAGVERTVPLSLRSAAALVYGADVHIDEESPRAVWHTAEHDVVLTLVRKRAV